MVGCSAATVNASGLQPRERRFLRGKTLGQETLGCLRLFELHKLDRRQYFVRETRSMALQSLCHALDANQIYAESDDHPGRAACIASLTSPTAARNPTNNARAMMAWPIFSSAIPAIAAIDETLSLCRP